MSRKYKVTMRYHDLPIKVNSESEVTQSCLTLCDPVDCSLPGSSIHGILQARILEWVVISFSRDLSNPGIEPGSPSLQTDALPSEPPGNPMIYLLGWLQKIFLSENANHQQKHELTRTLINCWCKMVQFAKHIGGFLARQIFS